MFFQYDLVGETDRKGKKDPKRRAAEIMRNLDINDDRKLSKEEFITGYILFYDTYDFCIFYILFFIRCKNDPHICRLLAPEV